MIVDRPCDSALQILGDLQRLRRILRAQNCGTRFALLHSTNSARNTNSVVERAKESNGGEIVKKSLFFFTLSFLVLSMSAFAQVSTYTGTIFGKVFDDAGKPLPGVTVTLESSLIPSQTATTQASGGFRFANLPPGTYSVNVSMEGFTEVRQEEIQVTTGRTVELSIPLKASLQEEFTVIGETPAVDTTKTGNELTFLQELSG